MCYFVQCFFVLTALLLAIADSLFENDNMNGPVPDAVPLEPYFEPASSTTIDQFQTDLTLKQPGDYPDPDIVPFDMFLPDCTTPPRTHALCCTRLPITSPEGYMIQIFSFLRGDDVVYGCTKFEFGTHKCSHPENVLCCEHFFDDQRMGTNCKAAPGKIIPSQSA